MGVTGICWQKLIDLKESQKFEIELVIDWYGASHNVL